MQNPLLQQQLQIQDAQHRVLDYVIVAVTQVAAVVQVVRAVAALEDPLLEALEDVALAVLLVQENVLVVVVAQTHVPMNAERAVGVVVPDTAAQRVHQHAATVVVAMHVLALVAATVVVVPLVVVVQVVAGAAILAQVDADRLVQ